MKGRMVISLMLALALVLGGMLLGTDGLEAAAKQMGAKMPGGGLSGLGGGMGLPPGLSGFGKKK